MDIRDRLKRLLAVIGWGWHMYSYTEIANLMSLQLSSLDECLKRIDSSQYERSKIRNSLTRLYGEAKNLAYGRPIRSGNLPAIPVISGAFIDIRSQIGMIGGIDGISANVGLRNSPNFSGEIASYWLVDVDIGARDDVRGLGKHKAEKVIRGQNRLPITAAEGIGLCIAASMPFDDLLVCNGTRAIDPPGTVAIRKNPASLVLVNKGMSGALWQTPSCAGRIV